MTSSITRHLSLKARMTRRDFIPYPVGFFVGCGLLGWWQQSLPEGGAHELSMFLAWPLLAITMLAASKRCRDANVAPWMGIAAVLIPFGLIVLMILHPTYGANEFGPNPRRPDVV